MQKMTQERLENLIERSLKMKPTKDHAGHLHLRLNPAIKLGSDEAHSTNLDLVVQFILDDKNNGSHQSLEIFCFAPVWPDKPYPLTVKKEHYPEASEFCSQLPKMLVPHVKVYFTDNGFFYAKRDIEDPGMLPDDWIVKHWLGQNFGMVTMAFALIYKRFGNKS